MTVHLELDDEEDVRVLVKAVRNQLRLSRPFNHPNHAESRQRMERIEQRLVDMLPHRGLTICD